MTRRARQLPRISPRRPDLQNRPRRSRAAYQKKIDRLQVELAHLQAWVKKSGARIVIIFEGRDAAGKGGVIKRITERVSPRVFRVVALPAPTDREKSQIYMQRYIAHLPAAGEIVIFDRSWYNRPGVERVMGFCSEKQGAPLSRSGAALRGCDHRKRHHAAEILPGCERRGTRKALSPAYRRSLASVEAEPDGRRVVPALVGLHQRLQ